MLRQARAIEDRVAKELRVRPKGLDRTGPLRKAAGGRVEILAQLDEVAALRWQVVHQYDAWAHKLAHRLAYLAPGHPLDDVYSVVVEGLYETAKRFDPDRGIQFSTYARWWCRARVARQLGVGVDDLPSGLIEQLRNIRKAEASGVEGDEALAEAVGISVERLREIRTATLPRVSLDAPLHGDTETTRHELVGAVEQEEPEYGPQEIERLWSALDVLDERKRQIVCLRYGLTGQAPMTLAEIGGVFGRSRERIRVLEAEAFEQMRKALQVAPVVQAPRVPRVPRRDRIVAIVVEHPEGISTPEVAARLGLDPRNTRTGLGEAVSQGLLRQTGSRRALRYLPRQDREEIAQEAVTRTIEAENVRRPRAFAMRVARNLAIDLCRQQRARLRAAGRLVEPDPVEPAEVVDARHDVAALLEAAPETHAEMLEVLLDERFDETHSTPVERDRQYKRRSRALTWARQTLEDDVVQQSPTSLTERLPDGYGAWLLARRTALGLSQAELARRAGSTSIQGSISQIERGVLRTTPHRSALERVLGSFPSSSIEQPAPEPAESERAAVSSARSDQEARGRKATAGAAGTAGDVHSPSDSPDLPGSPSARAVAEPADAGAGHPAGVGAQPAEPAAAGRAGHESSPRGSASSAGSRTRQPEPGVVSAPPAADPVAPGPVTAEGSPAAAPAGDEHPDRARSGECVVCGSRGTGCPSCRPDLHADGPGVPGLSSSSGDLATAERERVLHETRAELAAVERQRDDLHVDLDAVSETLDRLGIPSGVLAWRLGWLEGRLGPETRR